MHLATSVFLNSILAHVFNILPSHSFVGSAWIGGLNYGSSGSWMMRVRANFSVRADTGKINSSPTAGISPIVRLQYGCNSTIQIPGI